MVLDDRAEQEIEASVALGKKLVGDNTARWMSSDKNASRMNEPKMESCGVSLDRLMNTLVKNSPLIAMERDWVGYTAGHVTLGCFAHLSEVPPCALWVYLRLQGVETDRLRLNRRALTI